MNFTDFIALYFVAMASVAVFVPMINAIFRLFHYTTEDDNQIKTNFKND